MTPLYVVVFAAAGYLIGSIPWGVIVGKTAIGVDVREHGSGSMGATNVLRTVGIRASALVFALDILKGVVPVLAAGLLVHSPEAQVAAALAALLGHNWPLFAKFRGGKGVATSAGSLLVLAPWAAVVALAVAVPVMVILRYVSLGSILGAITGLVAVLYLAIWGGYPMALVVYAPLAAALILIQHRQNFVRLVKGVEPKTQIKSPKSNPRQAQKV